MKKLWLSWFLLAAVGLAACGQATAVSLSPTSRPLPSTQNPIPTSLPAKCIVESTLPPITPTESTRFAPVTDKDWTLGPADAAVTFLEYSDYM